MSISKGKVVALVGPSGAGKSSLFALLQRFYDPQEGSISFGGCDIRELDLTSLRRQIGVVEQQPTLFTGDVLYNIRYGMPDASDDEVIEAAKAAHADEFIGRLPDGYKSDLGEQGVRLSGGQRQRIAIARALSVNPRILVLDEPTSALDVLVQSTVIDLLNRLRKEFDLTYIFISHDLSLMRNFCNRVAVMFRGNIIETGNVTKIFEEPSHNYTRALLSAIPVISREEENRKPKINKKERDEVLASSTEMEV